LIQLIKIVIASPTPSPSIPPPSRGREAKPLPLDGGEVGERVVVKSRRIIISATLYKKYFHASSL
jgi:hypothetical protein